MELRAVAIVSTFLLLGASYHFWSMQRPSTPADSDMVKFDEFIEKYNKVYADQHEFLQRFRIFKENLRYIKLENAKRHSYSLGLNEFADQEPEEFGATHLGLTKPAPGVLWEGAPHLGTHVYSGNTLPSSVDWTEKGAVTTPKNQAHCGSCWAFSSTGALEGAWKIHSGELVSFSEQQLVDCAKTGNNGCKGGLMDHAFSFYKSHAVCTEASYPYLAKDGICAASKCTPGIPAGGVKGFKDVDTNDERALMEAVAQQPVSVAIEADQMSFQLYHGGVLTKMCGTKLDHGVLLVGYGTSEDNVPYWKVKNSWGAAWGEKGFIRIERGAKKDSPGECGVQSSPSYPIVTGNGPAPGPSPAPTPSPSPPSPAPTGKHYEAPPCASEEVKASIDGLAGATCAPKCDDQGSCPAAPQGSYATAQCILKDSDGNQYCALTCVIDDECPKGAKCEKTGSSSFMGLCMYPGEPTAELGLSLVPSQYKVTAVAV